MNKSTTLYQAENKYTRYGQMLVFYMFHYFTTNSDIILAYIYFLIKIPACVFFGDLTRFVYLHAAPIHFTLSIACNKEVERRRKTWRFLAHFIYLRRILQKCGRNWVYFSLWSQDVLASVNQHSWYLLKRSMLNYFFFTAIHFKIIYFS